MTLSQLNSLDHPQFVEAVGWTFEHSPWVAERAWQDRPFTSLEDLSLKMNAVVEAATEQEQLALLRAHPDLGTRARISPGSASEQAAIGLHRLTDAEYDTLLQLNAQYQEKFGFPFIFAIKGSAREDILIALTLRLDSDAATELHQALWEVFRIARFRLETILEN